MAVCTSGRAGRAVGRQIFTLYSESIKKWLSSEAKMVSTCLTCRVETEIQMEGPRHTLADVSIQTDLPRTERAAQTIRCREFQYLKVPIGPEGRVGCHGCKCDQADEL